MSRTVFLLAIVYFLLVEIAIILHSPQGPTFFRPFGNTARAIRPRAQLEPEPQMPDYTGEQIVYDVKMGAVRIGTSTFHHRQRVAYNGSDAHLVVFTTKAVKIQDTETIWADTKEFLPLRIERDVRMWPKYEQITEVYDQQARSLNITKTAGNRQETSRIVKDGPIHNAILLPYQVRRIPDLAPGWSMKVALPTQEFEIRLKAIDEVNVPAGTFKAFYFESEPKRFEIWVSADDRRIPVKIRGSSGLNYTMAMRSYSK